MHCQTLYKLPGLTNFLPSLTSLATQEHNASQWCKPEPLPAAISLCSEHHRVPGPNILRLPRPSPSHHCRRNPETRFHFCVQAYSVSVAGPPLLLCGRPLSCHTKKAVICRPTTNQILSPPHLLPMHIFRGNGLHPCCCFYEMVAGSVTMQYSACLPDLTLSAACRPTKTSS